MWVLPSSHLLKLPYVVGRCRTGREKEGLCARRISPDPWMQIMLPSVSPGPECQREKKHDARGAEAGCPGGNDREGRANICTSLLPLVVVNLRDVSSNRYSVHNRRQFQTAPSATDSKEGKNPRGKTYLGEHPARVRRRWMRCDERRRCLDRTSSLGRM